MTRLVSPSLFEMDMVVRIGAPNVPPGRLATALRWRLSPDLGIPREPFQVFQRSRQFPLFYDSFINPLVKGPIQVQGERRIEWDEWHRHAMMEVTVSTKPASNRSLTFQALDHLGKPILGEAVTITSGSIPQIRPARLRTPNICALQVTGDGEIQNVTGATLDDLANGSGWELIQTVGLPFPPDEVPFSVYDARPLQGSPAIPLSGIEAAKHRLELAKSIYQPPSTHAPSGTPASAWKEPITFQILEEVTGAPDSLLGLIFQMLSATDPTAKQAAYRRSIQVPPFKQPGSAPGQNQEPATFDLGVAGLALLAVATDSWTALALGFGTTVYPQELVGPPPVPRVAALSARGASVILPQPTPIPDMDYMVTANWGTVTRAAVAALVRFPVVAPSPLQAKQMRRHRPMVRDQSGSEDVELRWSRPVGQLRPHQYALGILPGGGSPQVLNEPRVDGGFIPYVPARRPDGDVDNEHSVSFVDNVRPVPLTGSRTDTYMCAAQDVFGRWSAWVEATHVIEPDPPPPPPQILKAAFSLGTPAGSGRAVHAVLELDFAWDWEDRSPQEVRVVGMFFGPKGDPPDLAPKGFHNVQGPPGNQAPLTIVFTGGGVPQVVPSGGGTIVQLPAQDADGEIRRYRLTYPFFTLDFSAATRVAFAVYSQASLKVDPLRFGGFSAPAVARAADPLPAAPPLITPKINWTALPDATGVGRARLSFDHVPHATGYVVYEASEAALRAAVGLVGPPPDPDIIARATVLLGVPGNPGIATRTEAMDAFARVHPELLPSPAVEVKLPAAVDGLYAYTFTSVTAGQVESVRSPVTLVAVPRRITPGAPSLRRRVEGGGVRIRVVPGAGPPPSSVALHRTSTSMLVSDLDLMGPPVADQGASAWTVEDGVFTLLNPVTPSWRPYFYRAVAYGLEDLVHGKRAGRSQPSAVMDVLLPPSTAPDLTALQYAKVKNGTLLRVQVCSSADIRISPLGVHRIEFLTVDRSGPLAKESLHAKDELPTILPLTPSSGEVAGQALRGDRDGAGRYLYQSYVPVDDQELLVRLYDPLGRVSTLRVSLVPDLTGLETIGITNPSSLQVSVRSAAPITPPATGAYQLALFGEAVPKSAPLKQAQLHTIGTVVVPGQFVRSGPGPDGRFTYSITLAISPGSVDVVLVRLTDPLGFQSELSANVVFGGGGPDI